MGEVHALFGENGVGKLMLMRIIAGDYWFDVGELVFDGWLVELALFCDVLELGVRLVT